MSLFYKVFYALGITPWEDDSPEGPAAQQIATLFAREERGSAPPFGPALDLGCGSGIWSVRLAQRGWKVTGVDIIPKAIHQARARAAAAGVTAQFTEGDVAQLRSAGVGSGFRFVVDFECFNHLNEEQRRAAGREVSAVTASDATMLLLVWAPGRRGPIPSGASRRDIETAYPDWRIIGDDEYAARSTLPWWLSKVDLRFYRLFRS